jgi:hypothetical protein
LFLGQLRPEMFPGIGALPEPATESHVVNRGTPVAPCRLKGPEKKSHPRGKPLQSRFPKYHELFEEPHHCKAASRSLTAKGRVTAVVIVFSPQGLTKAHRLGASSMSSEKKGRPGMKEGTLVDHEPCPACIVPRSIFSPAVAVNYFQTINVFLFFPRQSSKSKDDAEKGWWEGQGQERGQGQGQ